MKNFKNDPREIKACFKCYCKETGKIINPGELCIYYPLSKEVYSIDSKQAQTFYEWKFDTDVLNIEY